MSKDQVKFNPIETLADATIMLYNFFFDKDAPLDARVLQVLEGTNMKNHLDQVPRIINRDVIETGERFIFNLPPGLTLKDFENRRDALEQFTNTIVELESRGPAVIMSLHSVDFPTNIPYRFNAEDYPKMLAPFPVGVAPNGKLIVEDLAKFPHLMVGGMTGYGKTSELTAMLVSFLLAGCRVSAIDRKRLDFPRFSPWVTIARTEEEAEKMLKWHLDEMERRIDILAAHGCSKIQEYKGNDLPYRVLIIDELAQIHSDKSHEYIEDLVQLSRASGISLILATQKPSAKLWQGFTDTRSLCAGRLCFYVSSIYDSQMILGEGNLRGASLPMKPGRCIWNADDKEQVIQSMFLSGSAAVEILEKHVAKGADKIEHEPVRIPT